MNKYTKYILFGVGLILLVVIVIPLVSGKSSFINVSVCPFPRADNKGCVEGKAITNKNKFDITEFQLNNGSKIKVRSCEFEDYWGKCTDSKGGQWELTNLDMKNTIEELSN